MYARKKRDEGGRERERAKWILRNYVSVEKRERKEKEAQMRILKSTNRHAGVKENVRRAEGGVPAIREEEKALFPFSRGPPHFD